MSAIKRSGTSRVPADVIYLIHLFATLQHK